MPVGWMISKRAENHSTLWQDNSNIFKIVTNYVVRETLYDGKKLVLLVSRYFLAVAVARYSGDVFAILISRYFMFC